MWEAVSQARVIVKSNEHLLSVKLSMINLLLGKCVKRFFSMVVALFFFMLSCSAFADSRITLRVGEVKVLNIPDVEQVAVGSEDIIKYRPLDNGEFILIGASAGESSIHIWQRGNRQKKYAVIVKEKSTYQSLRLARHLAKDIRGLEVTYDEGKIIFKGDIPIEQKDNYLVMLDNFEDPVSLVTYGNFDFLPVVRIDVMLLEVKKRAIKELGIQWDTAIGGPVLAAHKAFKNNDFYRVTRSGPNDNNNVAEGIIDAVPNDYNFYSYAGITSYIGSVVNILEENGDAEVISAPKLMAKSGESASFLSGGEFPVAVVNNEGQIEVDFKEYGVRMDITPQVDKDNNINTRIFTELSSIDFGNAVNGVPGVVARNSETTINLKSGETYAISGLSLAEVSDQVRKVPFLGDLPFIGRIFRSEGRNSDSTELVIIVTPHLLTPDSQRNQQVISAGDTIKKRFDDVDWATSLLE